MLWKHVRRSWKQISEHGLHGVRLAAPEGFRRGVDVFPAEMTDRLLQSARTFAKNHGRAPNLIDPTGYVEKLLLFKFFAPIPVSPSPSDKLRSCAYAPASVRSKLRIPRRPYISSTPELPDNGALDPGSYYFKSNHGSGTNFRIQYPLSENERRRLERTAGMWLTRPHAPRLSLWWYDLMERNVYLEEDLGSLDSDAPDWKFFVCNGKVEIFQVDVDRHGDHVQTLYDRDGNFLPYELYYKNGQPVEMPSDLGDMIEIAEAIGKNFDFIRVDMFRKDGTIYLGEIGMVPNGATEMVRSPEIDERLGSAWAPPWLGSVEPGYPTGHYQRVTVGRWD